MIQTQVKTLSSDPLTFSLPTHALTPPYNHTTNYIWPLSSYTFTHLPATPTQLTTYIQHLDTSPTFHVYHAYFLLELTT